MLALSSSANPLRDSVQLRTVEHPLLNIDIVFRPFARAVRARKASARKKVREQRSLQARSADRGSDVKTSHEKNREEVPPARETNDRGV